jgi:hypothetical protein
MFGVDFEAGAMSDRVTILPRRLVILMTLLSQYYQGSRQGDAQGFNWLCFFLRNQWIQHCPKFAMRSIFIG